MKHFSCREDRQRRFGFLGHSLVDGRGKRSLTHLYPEKGSNMSLIEIKDELSNCSSRTCEQAFWRNSRRFEDGLLGFKGFPEEYFNFLIELISDSNYYEKKGVWYFLLAITSERHRLNTDHMERLKEVFVENYDRYLDEMLCHMVCDFVARMYEGNEAMDILEQLSKAEAGKDKKYAWVGLEILIKESDPRSELYRRALQRFREVKPAP